MKGYILRRGLEVIPTVLVVLTLVFFALRIMPGDPAIAALGEFATPDAIASFRAKLGLDAPLWVQYLGFVSHALTGDFGRSMSNNASINGLLAQALPYTLSLAGAATLIGIVVGIPFGALSAVNRNGVTDGLGRVFALIGFSLPIYPHALQAWGNNLAATAIIAAGLGWHLLHPLTDALAGQATAAVLPPASGGLKPDIRDRT